MPLASLGQPQMRGLLSRCVQAGGGLLERSIELVAVAVGFELFTGQLELGMTGCLLCARI